MAFHPRRSRRPRARSSPSSSGGSGCIGDNRPRVGLTAKNIVLVDDGLATGATMKAALEALRAHRPARIVVAVPVGSPASCTQMRAVADEVVCAREPEDFAAVGQYYADFEQTSDAEVRALLESPELALLHLAGR